MSRLIAIAEIFEEVLDLADAKGRKLKSKHRRKIWEGLGESFDDCMRRMKKKVDDPGAFCASIRDTAEGKSWRKGPRKKKKKKK